MKLRPRPFHNHNAGCLGKKPVIIAHTASASSITEVGHREHLLEIVSRVLITLEVDTWIGVCVGLSSQRMISPRKSASRLELGAPQVRPQAGRHMLAQFPAPRLHGTDPADDV